MALINIRSKEEKIIAKERERYHKAMIAEEVENRKKDKIAPENTAVSLQHINKIYDNHIQAVYDFNLDIKPKEFIVFVGPSGCGKSTTLRMIAGLEEITYGDLFIGPDYVNDLQPKERNIAMVFQSYALYPHMTVFDNIAFGLKMRGLPKEEIKEKVLKAAKILDLTDYLDRKPANLSGGQCQRVALGRAIVKDSQLFLMDEPLSNLDAKLRVQMRSEIVKLHCELGTTTIYVTHDQTEAMTMATRIVCMNKGYIQQIGTPIEIYNKPANTFVASFIGSPAMNLFTARYNQGVIEMSSGQILKLADEVVKAHDDFYDAEIARLTDLLGDMKSEIGTLDDPSLKGKELKKANERIDYLRLEIDKNIAVLREYEEIKATKVHDITFGIRPEDVIHNDDITKKMNLSEPFLAAVTVPELFGREYFVHFNYGKDQIIAKVGTTTQIKMGDEIEMRFNMDALHLFDLTSTKAIY